MKANLLLLTLVVACIGPGVRGEPLPGTKALETDGDLAMLMVQGIDHYLDRAHADAPSKRFPFWEMSSLDQVMRLAWDTNAPNRVRLREILGVVDTRERVEMRINSTVGSDVSARPRELAQGKGYRVYAVSWNVFRGISGEGLLLQPEGEPKADIIAVPDCDWMPEQLVGLAPGVPVEQQFARRFAEAGCRVVIPALIDRGNRFAGNPGIQSTKHSQRETLWRASYEMGRTLMGYEIQKLLAAADWLDATRMAGPRTNNAQTLMRRIQAPGSCRQELAVVGYGEGGLLALYAGAVDVRFLAVGVCGAFGLNQKNSALPIYRNVWSLLQRFGDAELASLIMPRALIVEHGQYPEVVHTDQNGAAPGQLWRPSSAEVEAERARLNRMAPEMPAYFLTAGAGTVCDAGTARRIYRKISSSGDTAETLGSVPIAAAPLPDPAERTRRQYLQILEDTQQLMRESEYLRREFWKKADFKSLTGFTNTVGGYRDYFNEQIVGSLPEPSLPAEPRSRFLYETNGYKGYEVVLDVHPDVFAYGILLVPNGIKPGERRPVVVCQHGLEGRPRDVADPRIENPAYHRFACQLAERGFVAFAPQNPYIGVTKFRQVLRKAQPLGLTLFSFIVRQHEVVTDWLASREFVDPSRIAFYGLSYGGKTAMRVPPLVNRYCLSICSADYDEWIWKNASTRSPYSYLWTMEYDMPEFNLGNTFNYAEMSYLISPRPFMVERGHDDGVAPDEWVAYEYAKTRRHYVKLGLADRTEIEFFNGPHTIHGVGTFDFLSRHLAWKNPNQN